MKIESLRRLRGPNVYLSRPAVVAGLRLDELTGRYLVPGTVQSPTFEEDTEWVPVIDGIDYFAQVSELLDRAGPGDSFFATGLQIESDMDLAGRRRGGPVGGRRRASHRPSRGRAASGRTGRSARRGR